MFVSPELGSRGRRITNSSPACYRQWIPSLPGLQTGTYLPLSFKTPHKNVLECLSQALNCHGLTQTSSSSANWPDWWSHDAKHSWPAGSSLKYVPNCQWVNWIGGEVHRNAMAQSTDPSVRTLLLKLAPKGLCPSRKPMGHAVQVRAGHCTGGVMQPLQPPPFSCLRLGAHSSPTILKCSPRHNMWRWNGRHGMWACHRVPRAQDKSKAEHLSQKTVDHWFPSSLYFGETNYQ